MSWVFRASLQGLGNWQYTQDIASPIIRVRWSIPNSLLYRGLIARYRTDGNGEPQFFNIRKIWSQPQQQILDFNLSDDALENSGVAFKVLRGVENQWNINIDGWDNPMSERRLIDVTQDQLVDNKVIINHNLSRDYVHVIVYDPARNQITPYNVREIDNQSIEIDFTGYTPLVDIYKVSVRP